MSEDLAKRLVEFRKYNDLSQEELASKLEVSRQSVFNWESGVASPSIDYVIKMAEIYKCKVDDIVNSTLSVEEVYKKIDAEEIKNAQEKSSQSSIHISKNGIFINDGNDKFSFSGDNGFNISIEEYGKNKEKKRKIRIISNLLDGSYIILAIVAYILLGCLLDNNLGWYGFWPLFVLAGVPGQILKAIALKKANQFPVPQIVIATYLFLGMLLPNNSGWHPYWVIIFLIPLYYTISNAIMELRKKNKRKIIFEDNNKD